DIEGVVFGLIKELYKNPDSDLLTVAKVETKNGLLTIQTTDNVLEVNDLVVCFVENSRMKDLIFKEKKLKNIISQGMFASFEELGFNKDLFGNKGQHIMRLKPDFAKLSQDPMEVLGLDDLIIDVSTTANRNDANSYLILAKELAAYYQTEFDYSEKSHKGSLFSNLSIDKGISAELSMFESYCDREFDIDFLDKLLLAKHGIDTNFSWAVNLTNLNLLITGAPTHVYDKSKIGKKITTSLYSGKLNILGNKEIEVNKVLVVNDENGPISIASVMGLENSKVDHETKEFLFEIGNFKPSLIRHSSKEIKLLSSSANQASRYVSVQILEEGLKFLRNYLSDAKVSFSNILNSPKNSPKKMIKFSKEKLLLYSNFTNHGLKKFHKAIEQLTCLGFDFDLVNDEVFAPLYRYDIDKFEDIIEEIFRFYSYDNFEPAAITNLSIKTQKRSLLKEFMQANGYNEVRTYTLLSEEKNYLNVFDFKEKLKLITFVSKEREVIRNSLIPSLLEVVEYNQKRKISNINIFEIGMVNDNLTLMGFASTTRSFLEIKRDIIRLFKNQNLTFVKFDNNDSIHPNVSAKIYLNDLFIGWIGKINPAIDKTDAYVAEFILPKYESLEKFKNIDNEPLKTLDLTFELQKNESIEKYLNDIKNEFELYDINLKDSYLKEDKNNVTLRITAKPAIIELINKKYNK
ncbi:phenylalanine--tRNA ligase subunit beta, partial [Mycoplasmopsis alligatoris]